MMDDRPTYILSTEDSVDNDTQIIVAYDNSVEERKPWTKLCFCPYCMEQYYKLARHLESMHKEEDEVKKQWQRNVGALKI